MNNLSKMQIATYLGKSDKIIDEVTSELLKIVLVNNEITISCEARIVVKDILVGIIHQQQATNMVTAETLFVQAKLIQDCEGDIVDTKKIDTDRVTSDFDRSRRKGMEGSDIDKVTNYSKTYCAEHKCPLRVQDGCGDNDEFYCGTLDCPRRNPDSYIQSDIVSRNCPKEECKSYRPYPGKGHCQSCTNNAFVVSNRKGSFYRKEKVSTKVTS